MPSFLFAFMADQLEEVVLSHNDMKEWHPGIMKLSGQLRVLDLGFTEIS